MQSLASFIMRGRSQATLVTAVSAMVSLLVPLVGLLSAATLALVTLRKGASEGLILGALSGLASGLLALVTLGSPVLAVGFTLVLWLPIWGVSLVLRRTRSLTLTVQATALISLLILVGIHLQAPDPTAYWRELLGLVRQGLVESGVIDAARSEQLVIRILPWMTSAFVATFYLQLLSALFIGRWWQALLYNPGGFGAEFRALRLHPGVGYMALGLLAAKWLPEPAVMWPTELLLLITPLFFLYGIAVAHGLAHAYSAHRGWLIGLYGLLFLAMPYAEILVAGFGFLDIWIDLRARAKVRKQDQDLN